MLFPQIVRLLIVMLGLKSYDLKCVMSETKVEFVSLNPYWFDYIKQSTNAVAIVAINESKITFI